MHFVCVGTPQRKGEYAADLRYVDAAVEALAGHLTSADGEPVLVVGKSTVPVGTAARLAEQRGRSSPPRGPARSSPGTRSSSARASPSRTP